GLFFDAHHPQHAHYSQFLRKDSVTIPTLLGKLLFVKPDSEDEKKREDYYCLIASMFFPWCKKRTPKSSDEEFMWVIVDLKKPSGHSPASSPYVQLSRPKT